VTWRRLLWDLLGNVLALGCLVASLWYGWQADYAHATYLLVLAMWCHK
jgi:hypothetical protein